MTFFIQEFYLIFVKKQNTLKIYRFLPLLLLCISVQGQTVRKYSNEFLNIGVDAAALGMSNAVTAQTADVNAVYWNPAGLLQIKDTQVGLMHASYFANIAQYDYAAYASPIDKQSAWGFSAIRFGVDDILNTTQLIDNQGNIDYNRVSKFSTADYAFTFSYARQSKLNNFRYGANAKVIRRVIGEFANSWGFGFDIGMQYTHKKWEFGLMLRDLTTTYNIWTIDEQAYAAVQNSIPGQNQELPESSEITLPKAQLGLARKFKYRNDYTLLAATNLNMEFTKTNDLVSTDKLSIAPALGCEFGYTDVVFVRTGFGNFQRATQVDNSTSLSFQPNIGLGFKYKGVQIDYALTDIGNQSTALYSNIFSVKVDLSSFR